MTVFPTPPSSGTPAAGKAAIGRLARLPAFALLIAGLLNPPGLAEVHAAHAVHTTQRANFVQESASQDAREVADWIVDSHDNGKLPFLIVDKKNAKVFVFDAAGKMRGAAPALLGTAYGDDSAPGIGQRRLANIPAHERTTPAGRFVGNLGRNLNGTGILWVDYEAAISLHRVITSNAKQKRAQRLASPIVADNRISSGCINVPPNFYDQLIETTFKHSDGIIYVLPETRSIAATFGSYIVGEHVRPAPIAAPVRDVASSNNVIRLR